MTGFRGNSHRPLTSSICVRGYWIPTGSVNRPRRHYPTP